MARITPRQCVISVRERFLNMQAGGSQLWLSDLIILLRPDHSLFSDTLSASSVFRFPSRLLGVDSGDVYLTGMTFVGSGDMSNAILLTPFSQLYVSSTFLHIFLSTLPA